MASVENEEPEVLVVGDEEISESAAAYLDGIVGEDETPVAVSAFDYETKVLAITDQRILVASEDGGWNLDLTVNHDDILRFDRDGRTLIIQPKNAGERRYKFGNDQTVAELVELLRNPTPQTQVEGSQEGRGRIPDGGLSSIAERVRFWEEQDKINQELIPRVIRQNELLTKHIAEHDSLPEVAGRAISEALAGAKEEQQRQYEAALEQALATVQHESRKTRIVLIGIVSGAVAGVAAALVVSLLT